MFSDFSSIFSKKEELEKELSNCSPEKRDEYIKLTKEYRRISILAELASEHKKLKNHLNESSGLLPESANDPEMLTFLEEEVQSLNKQIETIEKKITQFLIPPDKNDGRPVIVEIRAGTGGDEASLFASDLFRMYQRYAETISISLEVLSSSPGGKGGIKEIVFGLKGENAWRNFKYEAGTHRVQRVPETEAQGRIHTSAVTVAILAEPEEVELDINPKDLRIDTFRSSGPGGQSVNTMDSAIRVTHLPTNTVVTCQDEKSQFKNKQKALRILRARILGQMQAEENQKRSSERKQQIGSGDRSEKIRTYNFPQNRVTDHRINLTLYNLDAVINGKMDDLCLSLAQYEYAQLIQNTKI